MTDQSTSEVASEGVRARKAFMLRHFIPDSEWIMKNVVGQGKGTRATLGRVYGVVTGTDIRTNTLPDGREVPSVVLKGVLMSESYITGEVGQATTAYLPEAYSGKIATMFAADEALKIVEVDCDIGIEATGKTIPYEWVVIAYREGAEMATLKRIQLSRKRPASLAAPTAAPQLEAPSAGKAA